MFWKENLVPFRGGVETSSRVDSREPSDRANGPAFTAYAHATYVMLSVSSQDLTDELTMYYLEENNIMRGSGFFLSRSFIRVT